jgi:hypothetical protein
MVSREWAAFQVQFGLVGRIDPEKKMKFFDDSSCERVKGKQENLALPFKK